MTQAETKSPHDPSAADDQIILIKNCGLSWRNGALWRMQFHFHTIIFQQRNSRGRAGMIVTNLRGDFDWFGQFVERVPVAAVSYKFIAIERRIVADDDAIGFHVELHDIDWLACRDAET